MDRKPKVCLSGFVLSSLMFDCMNSQDDQEGFLIGTIAKKVKKEINDQSMYTTQEELVISIYSSVPSGGTQSFYNSSGHIRMADIESCLGERKSSVVGWYKFRRHSPAYPSFHESLIHRELKKLFSSNFTEDDFLIFGVLTSSNISFATHSFDYAFFLEEMTSPRSFKNLAVSLLNLGDTKGQYRINSDASAYMESTSFNSVLTRTWDFNSCWQTEDQISEFHKRLRDKLDNLQEEMTLSDAYNASLEHEVNELNSKMQSLLSALELPSSHNNPDECTETGIGNPELQLPLNATTCNSNVPVTDVTSQRDKYFTNEPDQPILSSVISERNYGASRLEKDAEIFERKFLASLSPSERIYFEITGKSPKLAYIAAVADQSDSNRTTQSVLSKLHEILTSCDSSCITAAPLQSASCVKVNNFKRTIDIPSSNSISEEKRNTDVSTSPISNSEDECIKANSELSQKNAKPPILLESGNIDKSEKNNSEESIIKKVMHEKLKSVSQTKEYAVTKQQPNCMAVVQDGQSELDESVKQEMNCDSKDKISLCLPSETGTLCANTHINKSVKSGAISADGTCGTSSSSPLISKDNERRAKNPDSFCLKLSSCKLTESNISPSSKELNALKNSEIDESIEKQDGNGKQLT